MNWKKVRKMLFVSALFGGMAVMTACGVDAREQYESGLTCIENKNYKQAASYLEKAVAEDDQKAEYYIAYGTALAMNGEQDKAILQFDKAILDQDNSIVRENNKYAYRGKGICYYNSGNYEEAAKCFEEAKNINAGDEQLDQDITYYQIDTCLRLGDYEAAKNSCDELLAEKDDAILHAKRAEALAALGQNDEAAKEYDLAIAKEASNYFLYLGKYQMLSQLGDTKGADEVLLAAQKLSVETDDDKYNMARIKYYSGDPESAKQAFLEVAEKGYPFSYFYLGQMAQNSGDYEGAIAQYQNYLSNPSQGMLGQVYSCIGACQISLGKDQEALDAYLAGVEKADSSSKAQLYYAIVALYEKTGKFEQAKEYAEKYLELKPDDASMNREMTFLQTR